MQPLSITPFAMESVQRLPAGAVSPPTSSSSTGTGLQASSHPSTSGSSAQSVRPADPATALLSHNNTSSSSSSVVAAPAASPASSGGSAGAPCDFCPSREWLYRLVTFPAYFTPCPNCTSGSRTPKREQLMTQFDTEYPYKVYCSHCPECKVRGSNTLLQVRRSAFKDVVKATDITRFGADIAGVQQYTLNGSKVIYLNREQTPEKKGAGASAAPAACSVDGRAMMDKSSQYCSLKCKMAAEDPGFNYWLDQQDPSVRIMAQAAANAPPRPTVASKRALPTSSGSSGSPTAARPKKTARASNSSGVTSAGPAAAAGSDYDTSAAAPGVAAAPPRQQQPAVVPLARADTCRSGSVSAAPAGLKPIRTLAGARPCGQWSAPAAFLEAAMAEPQLGLPAAGKAPPAAANCWAGGDLDNALSHSWDSGMSSPGVAALSDAWGEDGSMSPQLISAPPMGQASVDSSADWWLGSGGSACDAFTDVGMGGLLLDQGLDVGLLVPGGLEAADLLMPATESLSGAALMC